MENVKFFRLISESYPKINNLPEFLKQAINYFLSKILHEEEINKFLKANHNVHGIRFINEIINFLEFSFSVQLAEIKRIPSEGALIITANHPIGSLDGLVLIKLIYEVRHDVKILANDLLGNINNLSNFFIPINVDSIRQKKKNILAIESALKKEEAVIIFPAGEVSRLRYLKITDGKWNKGAVKLAGKFNARILPVHIKARNSFPFYLVSLVSKYLSRILLIHELFNKKNGIIKIQIGDPISSMAFRKSFLSASIQTKLLKKHLYLIGKGKKGIFKTEKNIIHPLPVRSISRELNASEFLGRTSQGMDIYLVDFMNAENTIYEIARLRELTFRRVGEGTGRELDADEFDRYYKHIVLWENKNLEIAGSYRIGTSPQNSNNEGHPDFYSKTLFDFSEDFTRKYLPYSIELGRSFVQKKYWNSWALNNLWQGIGSYIARHPEAKYLFGPVSLSNSYPDELKRAIIYFYSKWFGNNLNLAVPINPYSISSDDVSNLQLKFNASAKEEDERYLKHLLQSQNYSLPILYKHYTNICDNGGAEFLSFGVDKDFENCIDGLILVEIDKISESKKNRYINYHLNKIDLKNQVQTTN